MAAIGQFNPNAQAPLENYISIPKGEWNAKIIDSKVEGTDASNSKVVLTFEVDEGSAKGGKADVHRQHPELLQKLQHARLCRDRQ